MTGISLPSEVENSTKYIKQLISDIMQEAENNSHPLEKGNKASYATAREHCTEGFVTPQRGATLLRPAIFY